MTPGLNSINILCAAFAHEEPIGAKKTVKLSVFLRFWDLSAQKAVRKHVGEIEPESGNNPIKEVG